MELISFTRKNSKSITFTVPEIFTNPLAEDTWEKLIILHNFWKHQEAENASPSQEDPYLSPREDFKLIACLVQELWCSKVKVTNCDAAVAEIRSSST
jgi:hypothetical protein